MGRKSKTKEKKKQKLSISISKENFNAIEEVKMNRSKLINWLLEQHFNELKK